MERLARIGSSLFGVPLALATSDDPLHDAPAGRGFRHERDLTGSRGEPLGNLSLKGPDILDATARGLLDDFEAVTSAYLEARKAVGLFDHVTLLPNRYRFLQDMDALHAQLEAKSASLMLLTLADAKQFNEILRALGHAYAEELVRIGAGMVRSIVPAEIELYHVSVLSFAFLLPEGEGDCEALAGELVQAFATSIVCEGLPIATRAGVGMVRFNPGRGRAAEALRAALTAAQDSRSTLCGWSRYNRQTDEAQRRGFTLLRDLPAAIAGEGQLSLHFQPRVDLRDGRCVSAEALVRWNHPTLGTIPPGEFVPLVETTSLIGPLSDWVCRAGIRQKADWARRGIALTLAMNVSPNNLRDADFTPRLSRLLDCNKVAPESVELEFTEGALTGTDPTVKNSIAAIRSLGIDIAIDDFGTGYSNMSYLTGLPAQIIKIDQSFIRTMSEQPRQQLLVRAITQMAHALGFRVVAEGIETTHAYGLLKAWGCEEGQGYLMSKPLPVTAFETWFLENRA